MKTKVLSTVRTDYSGNKMSWWYFKRLYHDKIVYNQSILDWKRWPKRLQKLYKMYLLLIVLLRCLNIACRNTWWQRTLVGQRIWCGSSILPKLQITVTTQLHIFRELHSVTDSGSHNVFIYQYRYIFILWLFYFVLALKLFF